MNIKQRVGQKTEDFLEELQKAASSANVAPEQVMLYALSGLRKEVKLFCMSHELTNIADLKRWGNVFDLCRWLCKYTIWAIRNSIRSISPMRQNPSEFVHRLVWISWFPKIIESANPLTATSAFLIWSIVFCIFSAVFLSSAMKVKLGWKIWNLWGIFTSGKFENRELPEISAISLESKKCESRFAETVYFCTTSVPFPKIAGTYSVSVSIEHPGSKNRTHWVSQIAIFSESLHLTVYVSWAVITNLFPLSQTIPLFRSSRIMV